MTIMIAKYPGRDIRTGQRFPVGTLIDYDRWRKTAAVIEQGSPAYDENKHLLAGAEPPAEGRYISDVIRIGRKWLWGPGDL